MTAHLISSCHSTRLADNELGAHDDMSRGHIAMLDEIYQQFNCLGTELHYRLTYRSELNIRKSGNW